MEIEGISKSDFKQLYPKKKFIGGGTYGNVYHIISQEGKHFALKKMKPKHKASYVNIFRELYILHKLNHPNIISIYQTLFIGKKVCFTMDLMEIDLHKYINQVNEHSENETFPVMISNFEGTHYDLVKKIMYQIFDATNYIHSNNITHRDLKPGNILMNNDGLIKIADFGISKILTENNWTSAGTICYRAPELLFGKKNYSNKMDIWSIGCIFKELYTLEVFIDVIDEKSLAINEIVKILGKPTKFSLDSEDLSHTSSTTSSDDPSINKIGTSFFEDNSDADNLFRKCMKYDPDKRICATDAMKHPYFGPTKQLDH